MIFVPVKNNTVAKFQLPGSATDQAMEWVENQGCVIYGMHRKVRPAHGVLLRADYDDDAKDVFYTFGFPDELKDVALQFKLMFGGQ